MSEKVAIKKSTLGAIGEAVRNKEGSTDLIPVNALADRIGALPIASGENKLISFIEGTATEIKPEDMEGVTKIKQWAFYETTLLTKIELPNTITSIGKNAFGDCYNLVTAILPNSITTMENAVFQYCRNLENINIPKNLTVINSYTVYSTKIKELVIPNATTTIKSSAFGSNTLLKTVRIGNGITSMGGCFGSCNNLTDIYIDKPEGSIEGSPWGALSATVHWNTPLPSEEE